MGKAGCSVREFHEFQAHCKYCFRVFEGDSAVQAIEKAKEHEKCCAKRAAPAREVDAA